MTRRRSAGGKGGSVESMTGFGAAGATAGGFRADVEMRAVNGRYLSLKVRLPSEYAGLEEGVRRVLDGKLLRGNCELRAEIYPEDRDAAVSVDPGRVEAYVRKWRSIARRLGIDGELRLESLAAMPEIFAAPRRRAESRRASEALCAAAAAALEKLCAMRRREGAALAKVLERHLRKIEGLRAKIARRAPRAVAALVARAGERVRKVLEEAGGPRGAMRAEDLARETAWLAERADVSEEMDRLDSHVAQFRSALEKGGALGKRLDFLVQEMHRESNTTGSKAADTEISALVVELKLQVEKIREQVQNLV
ncbi:MAG: YicC/YloC family endoribonuclease [Planctomycetota bacterium]